ncbi:uncharacterized protein [Haliotis cracherodii]|uniref:uncharacterized protein n=1 Tax=Haliotis cracherodii TaxID=6455 RepID=UPI0039EA7C3A
MRLLLVFLLLALVTLPETEGWLRANRRHRIWNRIKCTFVRCERRVQGRDVDANNDDVIDQTEAENVIDARAVKDVLSLADDDADLRRAVIDEEDVDSHVNE